MAKRENGYGPVKTWIMNPKQIEEYEKRLHGQGPQIKKWQRNMSKEQFLQALAEGRSKKDIVLKHFNNDPQELKKQLKEWGMTEKEAAELAKVAKPIDITKEQYLQRRLNGETRSRILNSLGVAKPRAYELLAKWGIREVDAEERELELLAPAKPMKTVNESLATSVEQAAEARENQQWPAEVVAELEQTEAGEDILKRMEQRAAAQEQELANLQAAYELWKNDAERKGEHIKSLEAELERYNQQTAEYHSERQSLLKSLDRASDDMLKASSITGELNNRISELEAERQLLLETIEQAAIMDTNMITLQVPIMPVLVAIQERTRIYDALETLSHGIEGAEIDRKLVMSELFELLQRVVNFVTADLIELHPGQDATAFIHGFFKFYNEQHIEALSSDVLKVG